MHFASIAHLEREHTIWDMFDGMVWWEQGALSITDYVEMGTHNEMRNLEPLYTQD